MIRSRIAPACLASLALATAAAAGVAPHMTDKLLPPGVVPEDEFATSLDLDGDVAVVGAPLDDETAEDAGAAYVYRRINGAWTLEAKLLASNGAADDKFGRAVAVSGDRIVVLAPESEGNAAGDGSVYTFEWDGALWNESDWRFIGEPGKLRIAGDALSIDGDILAVSVFFNVIPDTNTSSATVLYRRDGNSWIEEHVVAELGLLSQMGIHGPPVSVHGDLVAIGVYSDETIGPNAGAVHILRRTLQGWVDDTSLYGDVALPREQFGWSVDLDDDTIVVGTMTYSNFYFHRTVYVYHWDGAAWAPEAMLGAGPEAYEPPYQNDDEFGFEVAISGDTIVVCDRNNFANENGPPNESYGAAYIFHRSGTDWSINRRYLIEDGGEHERFGTQIVIDGATALIGNNRYFDEIDTPSAAFLINLCGADLNADGVTDAADLGIFLDEFGNPGGPTDINNDGVTDTADLGQLIANFGTDCP